MNSTEKEGSMKIKGFGYLMALWTMIMGWFSPVAADEAQDLRDSLASAENWLKVVDAGNYGESWNAASNTFKFTIKKDEWIKAEEKLRKPLGKLISRKLVEQRPAKNPKGLPAGDYMVIYFKTVYANRHEANELVTLVKSDDGVWRVLTYHSS